MSRQNQATLAVYDRLAKKYMDNTVAHSQLSPEKARKKQSVLEEFLLESFNETLSNGKILEIGSGDGSNALFLKNFGFDIIASDVADAFLASCRAKGLTTIKLNAIEDEIPSPLVGVLAWRTFVHFAKEDLAKTFQKIYAALTDNGVFVFNILNKAYSGVDEQWMDFPDEYKMGEQRFFAYYTDSYIKDLATKTGFKIKECQEQGGNTGNKWLCFVLQK